MATAPTDVGKTRIPQPPRTTDNLKLGYTQLQNYVEQLYRDAFVSGEVLQRGEQSQAQPVDVADLPNPATATVATAQQTANDAYIAAATAQQAATTVILARGQAEISGTDTSVVVAFDEPAPSADYIVVLTRTGTSGSASNNSAIVDLVTKTTAGFTLALVGAPGGGASVTFDYVAFPPP